jgi:hypothetical protein
MSFHSIFLFHVCATLQIQMLLLSYTSITFRKHLQCICNKFNDCRNNYLSLAFVGFFSIIKQLQPSKEVDIIQLLPSHEVNIKSVNPRA